LRFEGYHYLLRQQARQQVERRAAMPEVSLGIGPAEVLIPQPKPYQIEPRQRIPRTTPALTEDDIAHEGLGPIPREDAPFEYYMGQSLYNY